MRRLHGVLTAFALASLAGPAGAAEISRVVSSGEPGSAFSLDLSVRWDRLSEEATIRREVPSGTVPGVLDLRDELRYLRTRDAVVPRVAIGLYRDLELHAELPYVLGDDHHWRYASTLGIPSGPAGSTITNNGIDAQGRPCATIPCPLFPVETEPTVYHGGAAGDLTVGLAWAIFNDRKDDTKPTWVVGLDVTAPTAALYEPAKDRGAGWVSPHTDPNETLAPFGEKIWKWDLYTVLSRRFAHVDPYIKAHGQLQTKSSSTYSNCKYAAQMEAAGQMNTLAVENCAAWGEDAGAKLPWIFGVTVGTEVIPYDDPIEHQKVSLDFRFFADYTSKSRFYNELTDMTGKLHMTEGYLEMGGLVGLYLRASRYVSLQARASLATRSAHYLTGEALGNDGSTPPLDPTNDPANPGFGRTLDPARMNPNYDWRYDAPGSRFRIAEVSVFQLSVGAVISF